MAPAKTAAKKAAKPAGKAAPSNKDRVLAIAKAAGEEGIDLKSVAAQAGVSQDTVRKAVKALEDEGKVTRDGPGRVIAKLRVGRRSAEVVERDEKILAAIAGSEDGLPLEEVASVSGTTKRLAYESVWRLREQGKVAREGSTRSARWVAT